MNVIQKSVSKVKKFFNQLKTYSSHNIIIYSNYKNAFDDAIKSDERVQKISEIDGEIFTVKPNIKVKNFPYNAGIKELENSVAKNDDPIINTIKQSGGIIVGSTNMD